MHIASTSMADINATLSVSAWLCWCEASGVVRPLPPHLAHQSGIKLVGVYLHNGDLGHGRVQGIQQHIILLRDDR